MRRSPQRYTARMILTRCAKIFRTLPTGPGWSRIAVGWAACLVLAPQALATWSIVVMNRVTGEVGVTSATCIANLDLRIHLPVIVVGKGGAAAQSFIDTQANNRQQIRMALEAGYPAERILHLLGATDTGHQTRQYGLVTRMGPPLTFTGSGAGLARFGVVGSIGDYDYAIQGNVLTGDEVILAAESAFRAANGDMAERMMLGMEAAMALGGDGRCSCSAQQPTSCGVPPANFTHSAYTGFFIIARPGDTDGPCNGTVGCASGDYYVNLNFAGNSGTLDPVIELRNQFDAWRAGLVGVPDHFQSEIALDREALWADGADGVTASVTLKDVQGVPLGQNVQALEVAQSAGRTITAAPTVTAHGNGSYTVAWNSNLTPGHASFELTAVLAGGERIALGPEVELTSQAPAALVLGAARYVTSEGTAVPVRLRIPGASGVAYRVLASTQGTSPGSLIGGVQVPLNPGGLLDFTQALSGGAPFAGSVGVLDNAGAATATFAVPPGRLLPFVGQRLSFAALVQTPQGWIATNAGSILIEF